SLGGTPCGSRRPNRPQGVQMPGNAASRPTADSSVQPDAYCCAASVSASASCPSRRQAAVSAIVVADGLHGLPMSAGARPSHFFSMSAISLPSALPSFELGLLGSSAPAHFGAAVGARVESGAKSFSTSAKHVANDLRAVPTSFWPALAIVV